MLHIKGTAVLDTLRSGRGSGRIISRLDPETREIFSRPISPRFPETDIRETAGGNQQELVRRAEAVIEKQLSGIYKMFVRLGLVGVCDSQDCPPSIQPISMAFRLFRK